MKRKTTCFPGIPTFALFDKISLDMGLETPESLRRKKIIEQERRKVADAKRVFELIKEKQKLIKEMEEFIKKYPEAEKEFRGKIEQLKSL